jgi:hypothetical protein
MIVTLTEPAIDPDLIDAIATLPLMREVEHCGTTFSASPFAFLAVCPACKTKVKLRSFSGMPEIQDVFDAVFTWMNQPGAAAIAESRRREIEADPD